MAFNLPTTPAQPDLGSPTTYNARALGWFTYLGGSFKTYLEGLTAADFFNVQTSATDTTPGALTAVGAFGLGAGLIPYTGDIDDITLPSGLYYAEGASTGDKPDNNGSLVVLKRATVRVTQIFSASSNKTYIRNYGGSAWTSWSTLYGSGNILGTVSKSGLVPTGALFQDGSNSNGKFVKFADGTQICTSRITFDNVSTASGQVFISPSINLTFPAAFIATPVLSGTGGGTTRWIGGVSANTTTASIRAISSVSESGSTVAEVTAVGQWD